MRCKLMSEKYYQVIEDLKNELKSIKIEYNKFCSVQII